MKVLGLIGYPLSHSFSQKYFTKKFEKEGIFDHIYKNFPIGSISEISELIQRESELIGLNVTIPYKQQVIQFMDELDDVANEIGAVNTICIKRNNNKISLKGFNTDSYGFEQPLLPYINKGIRKKALILGTGGASKAVEYIFKKHGIEVKFVSRTPHGTNHLFYSDLNKEIIYDHQVIVNTSPIGMYPNINNAPDIPYQYINNTHILYDLVYNPLKTSFLKQGESKGATIINGLDMLHLQADKAWEIWSMQI